jgi:hypothetical protein
MAINLKKLLPGGLVAGVVLIVLNLLAQLLLGNRIQQDMDAWIPGSAERVTMGSFTLAVSILLKFVIGILLVWLYAAIRPRFGPGLRTASFSAFFVWMLGAIFLSDYLIIGMMSASTYVILEIIQLLSFVIAVWTGARMYSE